MYWGYLHLATILALTYGMRRSPLHFDASVCLLVWFTLRNLGYQYGVVETDNVYQTMAAFGALCIIGYLKHRSWVFVMLIGLCGAVSIYNGLHDHNAYIFKTMLGVFFQIGILTVFGSWLILRLQNSKSLAR